MKTMCAALACTTIMGNMFAAFATDAIVTEDPLDSDGGGVNWTADEGSLEEIEVTYRQASSYNVTIPKTITLDTTKQAVYSVKVTGDIDTNERVHVVPVDGIPATENLDFYMKDQTPDSKKADVVAKVIQSKVYWGSEDVANGYEETNNSVSAPDLTAGNWKGTFQVAINLETVAAHVHDFVDGVCTGCGATDPNAGHEHKYVDGKCDCGAIDPNHNHNYEDGTCTICGKNDSYETAPENEVNNWKYALDNENDIITLQQYTNKSATDVIVYANYIVNGKAYKAQLADYGYDNAYMSHNYMFCDKENIRTIIFSDGLDTSNVTNMAYMFMMPYSGADSALTSINFGKGFDTSNVTNMYSMFANCKSLADIDLSGFDTSNVAGINRMFYNCVSLNGLDLSSFDTSNVTNMESMFWNCSSLSSLDMSNFDTSNVTSMDDIFYGCNMLRNLDLSSFNTSKVTDMSEMFYECKSLENLNLSSFDTSEVKNMRGMFAYVPVSTLDLSNFNTSKVTNMADMFRNCTKLTDLDLTSFDTSSVINMSYMFIDCTSLENLDLSSFVTNKVTNMKAMFMRDPNIQKIYAARYKWSTSQADITNMFTNCGVSSVTYK